MSTTTVVDSKRLNWYLVNTTTCPYSVMNSPEEAPCHMANEWDNKKCPKCVKEWLENGGK